MGRALYRKYRSKSLDEVVGQQHITDTLTNALKKGAISHAYLFTGPKGVGKTSVARILAHEINNLPYQDESTHLDIIEIDAASNRRIDEIRDLRDKVHIAPTSAKYKVYIIDEVHMLTREAFNALLKTLEEPPEHVVFILATTEAHKLPETIVSRTQRFSFKPIDDETALIHLKSIADKEKLKVDDAALRLIAQHGRGSFRDSISMLDQMAGIDKSNIDRETVAMMLGLPEESLLEELVSGVADGDANKLFDTTESLRNRGASPSVIAQSLIELLRNQVASNSSLLDTRTAVDLMKALLPVTGAQGSFELLEIALLDNLKIAKDYDAETTVESVEEVEKVEKVEPLVIKPKASESISAGEAEEATQSQAVQVSDAWDAVLNALKGHHNTLYGILRMAQARVDKDTITLTFTFEFHRKQLQQNKHLDTLHSVITDSLGKKYKLDVVVKKPDNSAELSSKTKEDSAVANVSNIFGGAELLES